MADYRADGRSLAYCKRGKSTNNASVMSNRAAVGLFVTGTDTAVGKTYVTAHSWLACWRPKGHKVGVYKPVASGCRRDGDRLISDDAVALWEAAGRPGDLEHVCPQRFEAPLAPHLAAQAEGRQLDTDLLERAEILVTASPKSCWLKGSAV